MSDPVIKLQQVCVTYKASGPALAGLDLTVNEDKRLAVFGPNGSGKSTLLRVMAGLQRPTSGEVTILGRRTGAGTLPDEIRRRIGFAFQNPEEIFATDTVVDEIRFALECHRPGGQLNKENIQNTLIEFELDGLADRALTRLSGGEKQRVALASVLATRPDIIFLDEPTSYLDPPARREFLQNRLFADCTEKNTVVFVTQYWTEIQKFDRVIVLEQGQIIFDGEPGDFSPGDRQIGPGNIESGKLWFPPQSGEENKPAIEVDNLTQTISVFPGELVCPLHEITFAVNHGESVGVIGPTGAGKSTLAYHLAGLIEKFDGEITICGKEIPPPVREKEKPTAALLFQNPDRHLFAETVTDDVAFGPRNFGVPAEELDRRIQQALNAAGLDCAAFGGRSPFDLSGGEQRKAALAGTLALMANVIIFDEPTAYLDIESIGRLESLIGILTGSGRAVLVISHDLPFLRRVCPRWLILNQGELIYDGSLSDLAADAEPLQSIGFVE